MVMKAYTILGKYINERFRKKQIRITCSFVRCINFAFKELNNKVNNLHEKVFKMVS